MKRFFSKLSRRFRGWLRMIFDSKEGHIRVGREWMTLKEYGKRYQGGKP